MRIPDSIKKIMSEKSPDAFSSNTITTKPDIKEIIFLIKQKLSPECAKSFEEGIAYYKSSPDERLFLKGLLALYADAVVKAIRKSSIDDESKPATIAYFENQTKYLAHIFEMQQNFINYLNQNKKIIDVEELSYIMLGYAIETIRKVYNSQSQQINN